MKESVRRARGASYEKRLLKDQLLGNGDRSRRCVTRTGAAMGERMSVAERERRLMEASERFLRGEISPVEYRDAKRRYGIDYLAAASALAKRRHSSEQISVAPTGYRARIDLILARLQRLINR